MATEGRPGLVEGPNDLVALVTGTLLAGLGCLGIIGEFVDGNGSSLLHIFYLATGVPGIVTGSIQIRAEDVTAGFSRPYNRSIGIVYLLLFSLGVAEPDLFTHVFWDETYYDILHLGIGVVLTSVGFVVD